MPEPATDSKGFLTAVVMELDKGIRRQFWSTSYVEVIGCTPPLVVAVEVPPITLNYTRVPC